MTGGSDSAHLHSFRRDALHLLGCVAWIYICYITYGVLQEKIYLEEYGPDKKRFKFSLFLVFFQSIINGLVALIVMLATEQPRNDVPRLTYVKIGFSYIGAMFASNYALNFVSYPTQVLGKSCKLIPVMVMRVIILRHSYSLREYISVTLLTIGITFFTFFQDGAKKSQTADSAFGLVLLLISLTLDGFTGPTQEKTVAQYKPSVHQLMFYLNLYAVLGVLCVLIPNGELFQALAFLQEYPRVFIIISVFSLLSALGQYGILWTLIRFDSLTLTVVTTTRKFFTILASVIWFGHPLTFPQWLGVLCVFGGLSMEIHEKYEQKKHKKKAKIDPPSPTSPANVKKDGTTDNNTKANSKSSKQRANV